MIAMFLSPNLLLQSNSCSSLTGSSLPFIFIILISNIPLLRIFQGVFRGTFFSPRNYSHTADMISRHDMYMVFILLDYSLYRVVLRVSFLTDSCFVHSAHSIHFPALMCASPNPRVHLQILYLGYGVNNNSSCRASCWGLRMMPHC